MGMVERGMTDHVHRWIAEEETKEDVCATCGTRRHAWTIETPNGPTVEGVCKLCGAQRTYSTAGEEQGDTEFGRAKRRRHRPMRNIGLSGPERSLVPVRHRNL